MAWPRNSLMTSFPCLPPIPKDYTVPLVYGSVAHFSQKSVEPAGVVYHSRQLTILGLFSAGSNGENKDDDGFDAEEQGIEDEELRKKHYKIKKQSSMDDLVKEDEPNLYDVLEIGHLGFNASQKQIKKAYQKMILKYHPDKTGLPEKESEEDARFLLVQKAWETLGNENKKRGYDSMLNFDDSIPSGLEDLPDDEAFFRLYSPVFERNGRFSIKKPVPFIGDSKTRIEAVFSFYAFWSSFNSWREFSKFDEFKDGDVENAGSRYEKRWMIKQNENIRAKKKKKEYERLANLVQRAQKNDPRLIRHYQKEQEEKEQRQLERDLEDKRKVEEAQNEKRRIEEETADKVAKDKAERERKRNEQREKERQFQEKVDQMHEAVKRAAKSVGKKEGHISQFMDKVDYVAEKSKPEFKGLSERFQSLGLYDQNTMTNDDADDGLALLLETYINLMEGRPTNVPKPRKPTNGPAKSQIAPWTSDELSALAKAVKKFPGGSRKRWEQVSEYVNTTASHAAGNDRPQEACIAKVKELGAIGAQATTNQKAFEDFQKRHGKANGHEHTSEISEQADSQVGNGAHSDATAANDANAVDGETWTADEQQKLQDGLRLFPSTLDKNERWAKIAEHVGTKTKKECVERFKTLRSELMSRKNVATK